MRIESNDCITIRQLREFIKDLPDDGEVWVGDSQGLSNTCKRVIDLNKDDILIECNGVFK